VRDDRLAEPWQSFLADIDSQVDGTVDLHCLGGFVVADRYDVSRTTADLDVLHTVNHMSQALIALAGRGTRLHKRHNVYLDVVAVAVVPENYESRLAELHPHTFRHLRLWALEVHDLVLAKLTRNIDRDRDDVKRLARYPGLDPALLEQRYRNELRFQVPRQEREDNTLQLWLEMIAEVQAARSGHA
jgi:hypothetical protein